MTKSVEIASLLGDFEQAVSSKNKAIKIKNKEKRYMHIYKQK